MQGRFFVPSSSPPSFASWEAGTSRPHLQRKEFINTHSLMCSDTSWGSLGEPMLKSSQEFFQTRPAPPDRLEGQGHWNKESDMEE